VHFLSVFLLLIYFITLNFFNKQIALLFLVFILIVFLIIEYLRIEIIREIPILNIVWKYMRREKESDRLGGDIFLLIGAILVLAVFDFRIAIAAILMTIFGDLSAALVGKKFGKHFFMKERAWEGTLAEFFVNVFIGLLIFFWGFWSNFNIFYNYELWAVILVMALTATIVETLIYKIDDNLAIPVFAGFVGQVVLILLRSFG